MLGCSDQTYKLCKFIAFVPQNELIWWNVTLLIRRGSNFNLFAAIYCSRLGLDALPIKEEGNKGIKSKKGAMKCCLEI